MIDVIKYIKKENIGEYKENVSFKNLTTYKCGGTARLVVFPFNALYLISLLKYLKTKKIKYKVLGNGSNTLASDKDYNGVIIKLSNLNNVELVKNNLIVGAGANLMAVANNMSRQGYSGLEFACGIPGSVGGAVYMNAGAYLKAMSDIVKNVTVIDDKLKIKVLKNQDMKFGYRTSILKSNSYIVLSTTLKLERNDKEEIIKLISSRQKRRIESQPLEYPSAGSVFRNPEGDFAGRLIEECNLKGQIYGGAEISKKHANFIINKNNASASDIKYLMDKAHDEVLKKYNIDLIREQELFNWE